MAVPISYSYLDWTMNESKTRCIIESDSRLSRMGIGTSVALYLLGKGWPTDDILKLGHEIIKEVMAHFTSVRLPMLWASSVEGVVHIYEADHGS